MTSLEFPPQIKIHSDPPDYITPYSSQLLSGYYSNKGETIPANIGRASLAFCAGDLGLAQRIYDYIYKGWFMPASPILSNAPTGYWIEKQFVFKDKPASMPISCFALQVPDTIKGQIKSMSEVAELSVAGGGVGVHNAIRAVSDKAPGPIPFEKVLDGEIGYYRQGKTRRGALAYFLDVDHPDIEEHIRFRVPGGEAMRRSNNRKQYHSAVNLTDSYINQVLNGEDYTLKCPHTHEEKETLPARKVWEDIIETRALTGGPFLFKVDLANRRMPQTQKDKGLRINGSNICTEISQATNEERTLTCCLSSLNIEKFDEWKNTDIIKDVVRFLDNVIEYFIENAPPEMSKAIFSARNERAIGIGQMGWHSYFQSKMIPFESGGVNSAVSLTNVISKHIQEKAIEASKELGEERGEAPDMIGTGMRNSRLIAIAPNSNSADIMATSPGIEPWYRNIFVKDTRAGSVQIKNKYLEKLLDKKKKNTKEVWKDIDKHDGSVQHLDFLDEKEKAVFKTAMEMDQHWLVELAEHRGKYVDQAQSLSLFFPAGSSREYVNSVHLKFLRSDNVLSLYYYRTERLAKVDVAKDIERKALQDWSGEECVSCQG